LSVNSWKILLLSNTHYGTSFFVITSQGKLDILFEMYGTTSDLTLAKQMCKESGLLAHE